MLCYITNLIKYFKGANEEKTGSPESRKKIASLGDKVSRERHLNLRFNDPKDIDPTILFDRHRSLSRRN